MTPAPPDAKARIRAFLEAKLLHGAALRDDESFWETRVVDSLGILQLIAFLESEFGLKTPGRDVSSRTFFSIDSVHAYVVRRLDDRV